MLVISFLCFFLFSIICLFPLHTSRVPTLNPVKSPILSLIQAHKIDPFLASKLSSSLPSAVCIRPTFITPLCIIINPLPLPLISLSTCSRHGWRSARARLPAPPASWCRPAPAVIEGCDETQICFLGLKTTHTKARPPSKFIYTCTTAKSITSSRTSSFTSFPAAATLRKMRRITLPDLLFVCVCVCVFEW